MFLKIVLIKYFEIMDLPTCFRLSNANPSGLVIRTTSKNTRHGNRHKLSQHQNNIHLICDLWLAVTSRMRVFSYLSVMCAYECVCLWTTYTTVVVFLMHEVPHFVSDWGDHRPFPLYPLSPPPPLRKLKLKEHRGPPNTNNHEDNIWDNFITLSITLFLHAD